MRALGAAPASPPSPCFAAAALTGPVGTGRRLLAGVARLPRLAREIQREQVLGLEVQPDVLGREVAGVLVGEVEEGARRARQLAGLTACRRPNRLARVLDALVADHRPVLGLAPRLVPAVHLLLVLVLLVGVEVLVVVIVVVGERAVVVVLGAVGAGGRRLVLGVQRRRVTRRS